MKISSCIAFVICCGLSNLSWSYMVTDIDAGSKNGAIVGEVDNFVTYTSKSFMRNSSPATETSWVNSILNPDVSHTKKTESVAYYETNGTNIFAFELQSKPEYFVIKNSTFWALFENVMSLDWGVFDASELGEGFNLPEGDNWQISHASEQGDGFNLPEGDNGKISHVSEFNGVVSVPEPGSISLLVLGLLGIAMARRK
jgi:hypothetical protein